jgi:hypothetical protein
VLLPSEPSSCSLVPSIAQHAPMRRSPTGSSFSRRMRRTRKQARRHRYVAIGGTRAVQPRRHTGCDTRCRARDARGGGVVRAELQTARTGRREVRLGPRRVNPGAPKARTVPVRTPATAGAAVATQMRARSWRVVGTDCARGCLRVPVPMWAAPTHGVRCGRP